MSFAIFIAMVNWNCKNGEKEEMKISKRKAINFEMARIFGEDQWLWNEKFLSFVRYILSET